MRYGFFDDQKKEYVIETPETPLPWINYLGSKEFFSLISQTGGGYSFFKDAGFRRITRYRYNGVPSDTGGRMVYIKDGDVNWSPAYKPLQTELDSYKCRHGMGYTVFESSKNGLSSTLTCFVPKEDPCEVNRLVLKNESDSAKNVDVVSAVEWCLWNADDDGRNFQRNFNTGEVEVDGSVLYHKTEYRERRNHYAFYSVNKEMSGFDTNREAFLGKFAGWDAPQAVMTGKSGNSIAHGWAPMASHRVSLTLQPGESASLIYVLGYIDLEILFGYPQSSEIPSDKKWEKPGVINKEPAKELIAKFESDSQVDAALAELASYWEELLSKFQVKSGDENLDRMVNIWNQYQCMATFNLSRSASYYESGVGRGMGFRDSCQDLLGFVHMLPGDQRIKDRIKDIAAIQQSGYINCYHQYMPLKKKGNADVGGGFNDDPLWLIGSAVAYIKETGDASILSEVVPFEDKPNENATLFDHLKASFDFISGKIGPNGLPKIGRADWNDCLNLNILSTDPNESYQTGPQRGKDTAESVFIAGMFVLYGKQYAELCRNYPAFTSFNNDYESLKEADRVTDAVKKMEEVVLDKGWDGEWFLRAYDNDGQKVGSKECAEGKIFIEPQGMCVMAGIGAETGEARKALDSTKKYLTYDYGTCLLSPCYSSYDKKLGEVSSYPEGYKENGSVFCHNNSWVSIAEATMGNADEAFEIYRRICPAYLEEQSEVHRTEPYVYCQTISGQEAAGPKGEGKNSWLTGTAAWTFVNASQYLLGIQPDYAGLKINPCLPEKFTDVNVKRLFRGCEYNITIQRGGNKGLTVDGKDADGNVIPHVDGRTACEVRFGM